MKTFGPGDALPYPLPHLPFSRAAQVNRLLANDDFRREAASIVSALIGEGGVLPADACDRLTRLIADHKASVASVNEAWYVLYGFRWTHRDGHYRPRREDKNMTVNLHMVHVEPHLYAKSRSQIDFQCDDPGCRNVVCGTASRTGLRGVYDADCVEHQHAVYRLASFRHPDMNGQSVVAMPEGKLLRLADLPQPPEEAILKVKQFIWIGGKKLYVPTLTHADGVMAGIKFWEGTKNDTRAEAVAEGMDHAKGLYRIRRATRKKKV